MISPVLPRSDDELLEESTSEPHAYCSADGIGYSEQSRIHLKQYRRSRLISRKGPAMGARATREVIPFESAELAGVAFDLYGPSHVDVKFLPPPLGDIERRNPRPSTIYRRTPGGWTARITISAPVA